MAAARTQAEAAVIKATSTCVDWAAKAREAATLAKAMTQHTHSNANANANVGFNPN